MRTAKTGRALGPLGVPQRTTEIKCSRSGGASASFGSTAIGGGDSAKTEGAFGPLGVKKCQARKEYPAAATAVTYFGATTRTVSASTGDGREGDN